jgi:hypothetical protein
MPTSTSIDRTPDPLRTQLVETFETATFPLRRPVDLLPVLATGRGVFVDDDVELVALELALACGDQLSFPYESATELADDVASAVRATRRT